MTRQQISFTLCFSLLFVLSGIAQDQQAKKLLDALYGKYQEAKSITASFDLLIQPAESEVETQSGQMVQQAEKYMVKLPDYQLYNDGKNQWIHIFEANEVQWTDTENNEDEAIPNIQDIVAMYRTGEFDYLLSHQHNTSAHIDFSPKDKEQEYFKIRLSLNTKNNEPESLKFFYKDGSRYSLVLKSIDYNKKYPDDFFRFDPEAHPGVHIEDLRID